MEANEAVWILKPIIRPAVTNDYLFLRQMLFEAIFIPEGEAKPAHSILDTPELDKYVSGWKKDNLVWIKQTRRLPSINGLGLK